MATVVRIIVVLLALALALLPAVTALAAADYTHLSVPLSAHVGALLREIHWVGAHLTAYRPMPASLARHLYVGPPHAGLALLGR